MKTDIDKFVIFAYHRDVLDGLAYYFKNKCEFVMITGDTSAENRKNAMDTFKSDDNCRVAILSILAANCGLEFQRASVCIFTEMTFTPGEMIQAEDRIHRIGQQSDSVRIIYLIANNSFDEHIWNMISNKIDVVSQVLDGKEGKFDHQQVTKELNENEINGFVKGMMEVVKKYEERKKLFEEETMRIEKKRSSFEKMEDDSISKQIDLLGKFDEDDEEDIQVSLNKFAQFQFHKK